jgi:hypothetical protein
MKENTVPGSSNPNPRLRRWDWAIRVACLLGVIYGIVGPFFPTFKLNPVTLIFLAGLLFAKNVREIVLHLIRRLQRAKIKLAVKGPLEVEVQTDPPETEAQNPHERGSDHDHSFKTVPQGPTGRAEATAPDHQLLELTNEFYDILKSKSPSEDRTLAMAEVTKRITRIPSELSVTQIRACLSSNQPIAALVYLTKNPMGILFVDVAKRLRSADRNPFDQTWCLEILVRILDKEPLLLNGTTLELLRECLSSLPLGTMRRSRLLTLIDAIEYREATVKKATKTRSEGRPPNTAKKKK